MYFSVIIFIDESSCDINNLVANYENMGAWIREIKTESQSYLL